MNTAQRQSGVVVERAKMETTGLWPKWPHADDKELESGCAYKHAEFTLKELNRHAKFQSSEKTVAQFAWSKPHRSMCGAFDFAPCQVPKAYPRLRPNRSLPFFS